MTYLKKENIDKAICQKLGKKDVYENDVHNIYNLIMVQTNKKLQGTATLDDTFKLVKKIQYAIGYLII